MRAALALAVLLLLAAAGAACHARSPAAPVHHPPRAELLGRLRTWEEHDAVLQERGNPYVVRAGTIVFFGARHTTDRADPQLAEIARLWSEHRPTVALYEGRRRQYFVGPFFRFGGVSEARLVHELARRDGVRLLSLEPAYEDEVAELLRSWTAEQVALFFFTRVYWSEAGGRAREGLARDLLEKRTAVAGLEGSLRTLADVDRVWTRDLGSGGWRTRTGPPPGSYLVEIADDSRRVRGEHMARTLLDLGARERVFAVAGSGHVIRIEPLLRASLPG